MAVRILPDSTSVFLWLVGIALLTLSLQVWGDKPPATCELTVELIDAATGRTVSGIVQMRDAQGRKVVPELLLSRGLGVAPGSGIHEWFVLPKRTTVRVPQARLTLWAFSGLETDIAEVTLDLAEKTQSEVRVPLQRFYDAAGRGYRSANTHLHLQKLTRPEADRYLIEVPLADGLDVVFLSYLERAIADLEYTSNKYTPADLSWISQRGARFGNGEEHRHNFTDQGQGYGHVMLLNIPELIQPVSIGPGISKQGTDGLPLKLGIEKARALGSTVIWCHNQWGLEDIPSWIMGRLHANNIFDGGTHGSYQHSFYRYLNAGLHVPFSTGTDWFMYDFSRVYVPAVKPLTPEEWLDRLAQGHSTITNGPLMEFSVEGKAPGDTIDLEKAGTLKVRGQALGRVNFERIELVQNGRVIHSKISRSEAGHHVAEMNFDLKVTEPCWLALRTPPPPVKNDPELQTPVPKNEYGCDLFAHTSAVYITLGGREHFDVNTAQGLLKEMHDSRYFIEKHALFADGAERARVIAVYDEAIAVFTKRIAAKSAQPTAAPQ